MTIKEAREYAMSFSPCDIIIKDEKNLFLNDAVISNVLKAATICQAKGPAKMAQTLACKLAAGYAAYDREIKQFKGGNDNG